MAAEGAQSFDLLEAGSANDAQAPCEPVPSQRYGLFILDRQGQVRSWTKSSEKLTGWPQISVVGIPFTRLLTRLWIEPEIAKRLIATADREGWSAWEGWARHANGSQFWCDCLITVLLDPCGDVDGFSVIARDMSKRKASELELRRLAETDPLTGAYNRRSFLRLAARALAEDGDSTAFAMLDIDHFKCVNDRFGHMGGDQALQAFVSCVRRNLRPGDLFGRLGGEEFGILLRNVPHERASDLLDRLRRMVASQVVTFNDREIAFTVSIGLAMANAKSDRVEDLMARADAALYSAKASGRNTIISAT